MASARLAFKSFTNAARFASGMLTLVLYMLTPLGYGCPKMAAADFSLF
jgi:hypothetical protein